MTFLKKIPAYLKPARFLLPALGILILFNGVELFREIREMQDKRKNVPYFFPGYKFKGLEEILKDQSFVGYFTDKDLDKNSDAAQFAQAQYTLAPIILDLNNTDHEFILFDCTTPEVAFRKIKEIRAIPFKKNMFGIILARSPQKNTDQRALP